MTDAALVRLEVDGGIGTIRLDRPPMNALNVQVQEELRAAAHEAGARSDVSAVVIYGGEKVFAAGADIKEMATMTYADMVARSGALQSSFTAVARIPKPVVAAVTGYALGGGCELALCADFRVCGDNAKLGQPEIQLGVIPGAGGTQRLPRLVGPARAKDIIFTGRFVGAEEALRDRPGRPGGAGRRGLRRPLCELARQFVGGPGLALRAAKEAIDARPRDRPRHRPGARAAAVLRPVRHRRPAGRHGVVRRARPRQGHLHQR